MIKSVVVDTGPLVAILRQSDQHHSLCISTLQTIAKPAMTCWPVVTEVAWLLRHQSGGLRSLFGLFKTGALRVVELDESAPGWIEDFLARYESASPQGADAAVMYLAEKHQSDAVFTLDRRDFSIFRHTNGSAVRIIPE